MKILVFLQGTITMFKNAKGLTREERVNLSMEREKTVKDYASYVPIGNAVSKLWMWKKQGARICYLSAITESKSAREEEIVLNKDDIKADEFVLKKYRLPAGKIYHRKADENYKDVVERIKPLPDAIIEDDCESIGGEVEMTYPHLKPELKAKIKSIIVKEFGGIDHLPDKLSYLVGS